MIVYMNKLREMFTDYYKVGMVVLDLLLLGSMKFNPEIEWNYITYFLLISRAAFPFIVLFFGYKGMWIFYYVTAMVLTLDISFDDFTAITVFGLLFLFIPKGYNWLRVTTTVSYFVAIFVVASLHGKNPYHLFAHFIGCTALILTVYKLRKNKTADKSLILTNDERIILTELKKGKRQKEIEQFSQNTVGNKLKEARLRNHLASTEELLDKFNL